jgi:hypothetical protein
MLTLLNGLLKNLKGEIPPRIRREFLPKEVAYQRLREISGKSYPIEAVHKWEQWVREASRSKRKKR